MNMSEVFKLLDITKVDYILEEDDEESAGVLRKFIATSNGTRFYVKSGVSDFGYANLRLPITEVICYEIGKLLGFDVVEYKLMEMNISSFISEDDNIHEEEDGSELGTYLDSRAMTLVSVCPSFVNNGDVFNHMSLLFDPSCKGEELFDGVLGVEGVTPRSLGEMLLFDI